MFGKTWAAIFCKHLVEEIEWYREQLEHERKRAELAIDELLSLRVNAQPISRPTPREQRESVNAETLIEKMLNDSEFASVGETVTE